MKFENISL